MPLWLRKYFSCVPRQKDKKNSKAVQQKLQAQSLKIKNLSAFVNLIFNKNSV